MSQEIFVDAGAWVALNDQRDQHHRAASAAYPMLLSDARLLVTTNLVIAEA